MSNLYKWRLLVSFFYLLISITLIHLHCLIISRTATYLSRYWDPAFKSRIYLVCRSGEKVVPSQFVISNIPKLSFLLSFVCILYPWASVKNSESLKGHNQYRIIVNILILLLDYVILKL